MDTTEKNATLHQGSVLQNGRYTIVRVLGQGGFGITYQATTKEKVTGNLGEMEVEVPVAIKEFFMKDTCLRDSYNNNVSIPSTGSTDQVDKYRQKFIKEAHNLAQLNHPNIVHVADVFEENNTVYYVMQYLRDGSLRGKLRTQGRLPEDEAVRYTLEIAHALDYMHTEKHMCHYDVKPGNILLNNDKAMLIDFGISKNYNADGSETSATPVGLSKGFAPLEQFQQSLQDFSPVSDIYSLGATLYNLITGEVPPEASAVNEEGLGKRPEYVSEHIWETIVTAMQPRRKDRPQTMQQLITLLESKPIPVPDPVSVPHVTESDETVLGDSDEIVVSSRPETPAPAAAPVPPPIPVSTGYNAPPSPASVPDIPEEEDESTTYDTPVSSKPKPTPTPPQPPVVPKAATPEPTPVPKPTPEPTPEPVAEQPAPTHQPQKSLYEKPPVQKKSSKAPLIIGIFVLFLLIGAGAGFFVYKTFLGNDSGNTPAVTTDNIETVTDEPIYAADNSVAFTYTGQVNADKKPNGQGTAKYTDSEKDTYTGKFQNGMRVDKDATLLFKNGDTYKGSFVTDQFDEGVYTIKDDGSFFKGKFKDYQPYDGGWYTKTGKLLYKVVKGVDKTN